MTAARATHRRGHCQRGAPIREPTAGQAADGHALDGMKVEGGVEGGCAHVCTGSQPSLFRNLNIGCSGSPSEGQVLGMREDFRRGDASMDWRGLGWGPGG